MKNLPGLGAMTLTFPTPASWRLRRVNSSCAGLQGCSDKPRSQALFNASIRILIQRSTFHFTGCYFRMAHLIAPVEEHLEACAHSFGVLLI